LALLPGEVVWRAGIALILACAGRPEAARQEIDAIVSSLAAPTGVGFNYVVTLAFLAEAAAIVHSAGAAREARERLAPHADHHVCIAGGSLYCGPVRRYLGLASAACDDLDDAREQLEAALADAERLGAPLGGPRRPRPGPGGGPGRRPADRVARPSERAGRIAEDLGLAELRREARELRD